MERLSLWWNVFYMCGSASITLVGLLFVGVSLGSALINRQNLHVANAFLSPICHHFLHIFVLCCLTGIPHISGHVIGATALLTACWRLIVSLPKTYSILRAGSHKVKIDIDKSGWVNVIVVPLAVYLGMSLAGTAFLLDIRWATTALAVSCLVLLLSAALGAWNAILRIAAMLT